MEKEKLKTIYKFQFNNDPTSCLALASMVEKGWFIVDAKFEDGYTWFLLANNNS